MVTFTDKEQARGVTGEEDKFLVLFVDFKVPVKGERGRKHHFIWRETRKAFLLADN